jgi:hypothetical protein
MDIRTFLMENDTDLPLFLLILKEYVKKPYPFVTPMG